MVPSLRLALLLALALAGVAAAWGPSPDLYLHVQNFGPSFCAHQRAMRQSCSKQPYNAFTIHGLWPEYSDGSWPQFCGVDFKRCSSCRGCRVPPGGRRAAAGAATHSLHSNAEMEGDTQSLSMGSAGTAEQNLHTSASAVTQSLPSGIAGMEGGEEQEQRQQCEWPSFKGTDVHFWLYEWMKHGTCADGIADRQTFTEAALHLREQHDLEAAFARAGIVPSDTQTYTASALREAVRSAYGVTPILVCFYQARERRWLLEEVRMCVGLDLKARDCPPGVLADHACERHAECGDSVALPLGSAPVPDGCGPYVPEWGPDAAAQQAAASTGIRLGPGDEAASEAGISGIVEEE